MIQVLLFAGLAQAVGSNKVSLTVYNEPFTVRDIRNELIKRYPNLKSLVEKSMVAVNQEYALDHTILSDMDEIAFIPPVSGG
jgi:molybdopterin converting factor subunit 1